MLVGDNIVAAIDLKTDRAARKLLLQKWTWIGRGAPKLYKRRIEEELHRFEHFQLAPRPKSATIPFALDYLAVVPQG